MGINVNSKQKGSAFEREICKKLSLWVSEGNYDDLFWRSAMSGGRATVRTKKGQITSSGHGDITAVSPKGNILTDKFVIECKHYKDLEWSAFIYGKGFIWKTWDKLSGDSYVNSKQPFLILKQNMQKVVVVFNPDTKRRLEANFNLRPFIQTSFMNFYYLSDILEFANAKIFLS
jgi:hypothetical protein